MAAPESEYSEKSLKVVHNGTTQVNRIFHGFDSFGNYPEEAKAALHLDTIIPVSGIGYVGACLPSGQNIKLHSKDRYSWMSIRKGPTAYKLFTDAGLNTMAEVDCAVMYSYANACKISVSVKSAFYCNTDRLLVRFRLKNSSSTSGYTTIIDKKNISSNASYGQEESFEVNKGSYTHIEVTFQAINSEGTSERIITRLLDRAVTMPALSVAFFDSRPPYTTNLYTAKMLPLYMFKDDFDNGIVNGIAYGRPTTYNDVDSASMFSGTKFLGPGYFTLGEMNQYGYFKFYYIRDNTGKVVSSEYLEVAEPQMDSYEVIVSLETEYLTTPVFEGYPIRITVSAMCKDDIPITIDGEFIVSSSSYSETPVKGLKFKDRDGNNPEEIGDLGRIRFFIEAGGGSGVPTSGGYIVASETFYCSEKTGNATGLRISFVADENKGYYSTIHNVNQIVKLPSKN